MNIHFIYVIFNLLFLIIHSIYLPKSVTGKYNKSTKFNSFFKLFNADSTYVLCVLILCFIPNFQNPFFSDVYMHYTKNVFTKMMRVQMWKTTFFSHRNQCIITFKCRTRYLEKKLCELNIKIFNKIVNSILRFKKKNTRKTKATVVFG